MKRNTKSTKEAPKAAGQPFCPTANLVGLYAKGFERMVTVQKEALDLAAEQSADTVETFKKGFQAMPMMPGLVLVEMAGQAFKSMVETQKAVLDLAVEQNSFMATYVKQNAQAIRNAVSTVPGVVRESMNRGIAAQKKVLDFAAKQNKVVGDTVKHRAKTYGAPVAAAAAESLQKGVDSLIEVQKEMLDKAVAPPKANAAKA